MSEVRCKNCFHYKHDPRLNSNEGRCTNNKKEIMELVYWHTPACVKTIRPAVNSDRMWCDEFAAIDAAKGVAE
jgi:hypothetical protein